MPSFACALALVVLLQLHAGAFAADADLILHNGKVVTVDPKFSVAQAIAVKNGLIAAVGTDQQVLGQEKGLNTRVVDLRGRTVLPGLIDAHVHAIGSALSEARSALPPLDSIEAIQAYIREKAKSTPKGEWIVVPRTLPPRLREMRMPNRADLDIEKDHPVAFDGSYVWAANTKALALSGITRTTPNPPGGEIVKGPDGEPNGILRNGAQLLKGAQKADPFTDAETTEALEKMLQLYAASGLTAVGDRAVTPADVGPFFQLRKQNRLPLRVVLTWRVNAMEPTEKLVNEIRSSSWTTGFGDDWLKFSTLKVTLDGGQSVGTAYQRVPYGPFARQLYGQTNPDSRGTLFVEPDKLYRIFAAGREKGWQLTAHAQGGGAIDVLVGVFERLNAEQPVAPMRHHVMHGSYMNQDVLARMKKMGVAADVQPGWLYHDVPALQQVFGRDKMRYFFPLRTMIDMGIPLAGGSDHMIGHDKNHAVNEYNPFFNMWACITRKMANGDVFYPEERITRKEALRMWTNDAAWLQFSETKRGTLERGKFADMVVIDADFLNCPEDQIKSISPAATIVDGRVVYGKL